MNGPSSYAKTYGVYDSDGTLLGEKTAENANNYINPSEVKQAIEDIVEEANHQFKAVIRKDFNLALQKGMVVIDGVDASVSKAADESYDVLGQIPTNIEQSLSKFVDLAVEARNDIQTRINQMTYDALLQSTHDQGYDNVTIREK